jgi:hypothetical protein
VVDVNSEDTLVRSRAKNGASLLEKGNRRQLHVWISVRDYTFLKTLAKEEEEPVTRIIRRLIREMRMRQVSDSLPRDVFAGIDLIKRELPLVKSCAKR